MKRKNHWINIYETKELKECSWYQPIPETSLNFFNEHNIPLSAKIIDIGGGDSFLVDHLMIPGYQQISVLDIASKALERAKSRLGDNSQSIHWIESDVLNFTPKERYDVWHDRAAFHFLTEKKEIEKYVAIAYESLNPNGLLLIGTFSEQGPEKCSGIQVQRYSSEQLRETFGGLFEPLNCHTVDHKTPSGAIQNFVFCSFRKN